MCKVTINGDSGGGMGNQRYLINVKGMEEVVNEHSSSSSDAQSVLNIDEEENEYGNEQDFEVVTADEGKDHRKYNSIDVDHDDVVSTSDQGLLAKTQRVQGAETLRNKSDQVKLQR